MQALDEASMEEDMLRWVTATTRSIQSLGALGILRGTGDHVVYDFVYFTVQCNLVVNAILRYHLNVVFLSIFGEQKSESTCSNVFPSVLLV